MAIIARWRMPPENSCGYCLARSSGLGMRTCVRQRMASSLASLWERWRCSLMDSTICLPTCVVGFMQVIGSWKIMATSLPRIFCICFSLAATMSCSPSWIEPSTILAGGIGLSFMIVCAVTDLPQPLSPTMASTSPSSTWSVTPRTACTSPA